MAKRNEQMKKSFWRDLRLPTLWGDRQKYRVFLTEGLRVLSFSRLLFILRNFRLCILYKLGFARPGVDFVEPGFDFD